MAKEKNNPCVSEIIARWLKSNGYDGLFNVDGECACPLDKLCPCGQVAENCEAGYQAKPEECPDVPNPEGFDFFIVRMCDCYDHECAFCSDTVPVHLEDFETEREEIQVVCPKCLKKHNEYLMGKQWTIFKDIVDDDRKLGNWAFIYLTENAQNHREGNTPNAAYGDEIQN